MSRYHKNPEAVSRLSPEQYRVTQRDGTERPFDNAATRRGPHAMPIRTTA